MEKGHAYLVAIMDWHSRAVLAWEISNTMDSSFCIRTLRAALRATGRKPKIFNTDQGSQFTGSDWTPQPSYPTFDLSRNRGSRQLLAPDAGSDRE